MGRREHTPSGVATSCDYGILPFGLSHSGGSLCQNRITGDPRTASLRTTRPHLLRKSLLPAGRSSACLTMWMFETCRLPVVDRLSRVCRALVLIFGHESCRRHVTFALWTRRRPPLSGKKVLYTPHPGQGACAARPSRMSPTHQSLGHMRCPPTPHQEWTQTLNQ